MSRTIITPGSHRLGASKAAPRWLLALWLTAAAAISAGCSDLLGLDVGIPVPDCGDGILDPGEACDEGGAITASCDSDCTLPECGDGIFNEPAGELCDDRGDSADCNADCTPAMCGDDYVNPAAGEACDDGPGSAWCRADCTLPMCGDGMIDPAVGEVCDDGDDDAGNACTTACLPARCGDGFVYAGVEECDDANQDDTDACTSTCEAGSCADGWRNGDETDVDCGGSCGTSCGIGQRCSSDSDCARGTCSSGICASVGLAAGEAHTCILLEGGQIRCWGNNDYGQLGHGDTEWIGDDEVPSSVGHVDVGGSVVQIAAGRSHTCAVLEGGGLRCWGNNWDGQLGQGNEYIGDDEVPSSVGEVEVGGRVLQVTAGAAHTCALLEGGTVRCWGANWDGQLGYGHTNMGGADQPPSSAGDVEVGGRVARLAAGFAHTCALLQDGRVRCWGLNWRGELGLGVGDAVGDDEVPSAVGDVSIGGRAVQIVAGERHTCALREDGQVLCWGTNWSGELGQGHTEHIGDDEVPSSIPPLDLGARARWLTAGLAHTCALLEDGAVRCWGDNWDGQLGLGHRLAIGNDEVPRSVDVLGLGARVVDVVAGAYHTCALLEDGTLRCWGWNGEGQLGLGHTDDMCDDEPLSSVDPVSYR